ncbi:hypothetical protein SLA2020_528340 [Shorea laevis]
MQDIRGSVRRSLVFGSTASGDDGGGFGGFVEKIGFSIRKSRIGLFAKQQLPALPASRKVDAPPIRWRKGELIGCSAFGRVYMGMNLDSGELLAVIQVLIGANSASKEKTQAHIRELEEEVKLLENLSHPNIVRYLGTVREDDSLNILLEFVPGGSISSLLGKFGSFPESVVRMYAKQLLLGLEYLHKNGIMHRDIKGANILVDNKGCIKLADFGASKKVVELATITGTKPMKGTPYWMAPEVILQTGHSFRYNLILGSADIWSVGCTVIEMATGKPAWSQQFQEVAALFHIGTTKSHPPIPEHLSFAAKDFLLKCLQKEPNLRSTASDLLQHSFVTGDYQEPHPVLRNSVMEPGNLVMTSGMNLRNSITSEIRRSTRSGLKDVCEMASADLNKSFNPMCEPIEDGPCKFDESTELKTSGVNLSSGQTVEANGSLGISSKEDNDFTFPNGMLAQDDDEEVTESKIRAFLDEKAIELKKLQTPLYEEFYNALNATGHAVGTGNGENLLPPKNRSPKQLPSRRISTAFDVANIASPGGRLESNAAAVHNRALQELQPPQINDLKGLVLHSQQETGSPSLSFSERQRRWKEELDEELERKREMMHQAGVCGKTSSPKERILIQQREQIRFAFPYK